MAKKSPKIVAKKSAPTAKKAASTVDAKAKKSVKVSKPVAKKPVKPAKAVPAKSKKAAEAIAKPAPKKAFKPAIKKVVKSSIRKAVKPPVKKVVKPASKKAAKPISKKVAKPVTKKVLKPAVKKVVKPAAKKTAQPATKKVTPVNKKAAPKREVVVKKVQPVTPQKVAVKKIVKPATAPSKQEAIKATVAAVKPKLAEAPAKTSPTTEPKAAPVKPSVKEVAAEPTFILANGLESSRPMRPRPPKPSANAMVKPVANPIYVPPAPDGKPGIKFAPIAIIEKPKDKSNKSEEEDMSSKTSPRLAFTESDDKKGVSVEAKLRALYAIQLIDSRIDKIHAMRGELPLEVQDLEDDVAGLEARKNNLTEDLKNLNEEITSKKNGIKNSEALITKYKEQLNNVKNNREFDSLNKEIEFQELEIQLHHKRIKEHEISLKTKEDLLVITEAKFVDRVNDLKLKRSELDEIVASTEKEEKILRRKSDEAKRLIEDRLINAYERIRSGAPNGMAVVPIEREASAGSFIQLPPQKQLDVAARKRVIVDEHSGRILVDAELAREEQERMGHELTKELK